MKMVRVLVFFVAAIFSISSIGIFVVASMYYYSEGTSKENSIYGTAHEMETKNKIVSLPDTHDEAKTTTHMQVKSILQFAIVGFPKCSTTFLRNTLLAPNPQIFWETKKMKYISSPITIFTTSKHYSKISPTPSMDSNVQICFILVLVFTI